MKYLIGFLFIIVGLAALIIGAFTWNFNIDSTIAAVLTALLWFVVCPMCMELGGAVLSEDKF